MFDFLFEPPSLADVFVVLSGYFKMIVHHSIVFALENQALPAIPEN